MAADAGDTRGGSSRSRPFGLPTLPVLAPLAAVATAALGALAVASPIQDADLYWHVLLGWEIRVRGPVAGLGDSWSTFRPPEPWMTSQWLSELLLGELVSWAGWRAPAVVAVLAYGILVLLVLRAARAGGERTAAAVTTALLAFALAPFAQERPATLTLLAVAAVTPAVWSALHRGRRVSPWWILAVAVLAQLHGGWVVLPAAVALVALLVGTTYRDLRSARFHAAVAAGMLVAGSLTPLGPAGIILPLTMRGTTDHLIEWQPTQLLSGAALPLALSVVVVAVSWARRATPVAWVEVWWTLAWVAFGLTAVRNIPIATLLLLPAVAGGLQALIPPTTGPDGSRPDRRWLAVGAVSLTPAVVVAVVIDPLPSADAYTLATQLRDERPGQHRVLNAYNAAGVVAAFGGDVALGIDGRAERFGRDYVRSYLDALALAPGWQEVVRAVDPDVAILELDDGLVTELVGHQGWQRVDDDGRYVLLVAPPGGDPLPAEQPGEPG